MRHRLLIVLGLLSLFVGLAYSQEPIAINNVELISCPFVIPEGEVVGQTIICGELTVPENWDEPDGRLISLQYAILKTPTQAPFPDPVIYLEGGPGASALVGLPFLANTFDNIRRYRDVIIYDQRGTSFSTPLFCPSDVQGVPVPSDVELPELPTSDDPEIQAVLDTAQTVSAFRTAVNCRPYLEEQGFDLSQYSTQNSVLDLIAMMVAFDYESYNIYGISYGTNVALELFRYYEENQDSRDLPPLRSGIIDGVVPPHVDTRGGQAYNTPYNILRVFEDCEADARCSAAFPNIRQRVIDLMLDITDTPLTIGDETIDFSQLRRVLSAGLTYKQDENGFVVGIGATYFPLMISELEEGNATTFIGLRDGTISAGGEQLASAPAIDNPFANIANESADIVASARELADQIEQLQLESQRASDALSSGLPLPEFFIQEFRIAVNGLDYLTATFFPTAYDFALTQDRSRESLAAFGVSLDPEIGAIVSLMSDEDVEETYRLLEEIRPTIDTANFITLEIINCNDRYGSYDLDAIFDGFRSFDVPELISRVDVAANAKVACTVWGLTDEDTVLRPPVVTDLPILVANGSIDAETPVEWGLAAYENLTNAYLVTFAYYPHGSTTQFACGPDVAEAFILAPGQMPNISCADDLRPNNFPFVLDTDE